MLRIANPNGSDLLPPAARCHLCRLAEKNPQSLPVNYSPWMPWSSWVHPKISSFTDGHHQNGLATTPARCYSPSKNLNEVICHTGPQIGVATYASLLRRCTNEKAFLEGEQVHDQIIRCGYGGNIFLNNLLVQMYGKCGSLQHARAVFDSMLDRNLYTWNIMLTVYAQNGQGKKALELFGQMLAEGFEPDTFTSVCVLDACASVESLEVGRDIHASVVANGWDSEIVVGTSVVNMYGKCGSLDDARAGFAEMPRQDVISWNAMIAVCTQNGLYKEALQLQSQMQAEGLEPNQITFICILDACACMKVLEEGQKAHACIVGNGWESHIVLGTALVNMYGKCGDLDDARAVFTEMPRRNVVSWSALIAECANNGHGKMALQLFFQMQAEGFEPDIITFICILNACANTAALQEGRQMHASIVGNGWESDAIVGSALLNMYSKCESLDDARVVFYRIPQQNVISWNAMITASARNGHGMEALRLFGQMRAEGLEPDRITSICALNACASMAALKEGWELHADVVANGWECEVAMRTALINVYGKCGSVDDARAVFAEMRHRDVISWNAMIAVCAQNGHCKEALELFGQMTAEGFEPDKITFISVLTACSHMGLVADGSHYFASIYRDYGMAPSVEHYGCMIDLFGRAGQLDKAEQLINSMPAEHVTAAWLRLLTSCKIHGDVERGVQAAGYIFDLDEKKASPYVILGDIHAAAGV